MADREKIKMGMVELMAMSIEDMENALAKEDNNRFSNAVRRYGAHREIAFHFLDEKYIAACDKRKNQLSEEYSNKHNGVML